MALDRTRAHEGREGDAERADRFVRDAVPLLEQLRNGARRLTRTGVDADDLVQETMLRAYASFGSYNDGTNLRAWLFRIMSNTWINNYRTTQRRPVEYLSHEITEWQLVAHANHSGAGLRSAEAEALEALPDNEISQAMRTLPEKLRTAVYYADVKGFRTTEIAEIMDTPVGTIQSRLHRGRNQLRELLADTARERGIA